MSDALNYATIARERGYEGSFRMKVIRTRNPAHPKQLCLVPLYLNDEVQIEQTFQLEPDGRRIKAYPVSCWVGTPGKDYQVALRLNKAGTAFAAFPIDYRYMNLEWLVDERFAARNDFPITFRKKEGGLWGASHPETGQIILVFTHTREGEELWKVDSDDGKTSREYAPGTLTISRSIVSTILTAGPEEVIRANQERILVAPDEKDQPAEWEVYRNEAVLPLGKHFIPISRLVGHFLELGEDDEKQLLANLKSFRRMVSLTIHPDVVQQYEGATDNDREQDILLAMSKRFKEIDAVLKYAEAWLKGRFVFVRERRSVDEKLYMARGMVPPPVRLGEPLLGEYKLPQKIKSGAPLAFREVDEVLAILFPVKPERRDVVKTDSKAKNPSGTTAKADKPATAAEPEQPVKTGTKRRTAPTAVFGATIEEQLRQKGLTGKKAAPAEKKLSHLVECSCKGRHVRPEGFTGKRIKTCPKAGKKTE